MEVRVIAPADLDGALIARWREIQAGNKALASPFFTPEFIITAAQSGSAQIAVMRMDGEVVAFFPFQGGGLGRPGLVDRAFRALGVACPVGRKVSDCHGIIAAPGFEIEPHILLDACRINTWDFHRLPLTDATFAPFHTQVVQWSTIDLTGGHAAFLERMRAKGSDLISQTAMKGRRLARDLGPLRFVADERDPAFIDIVLEWRERQYPDARIIDGMERADTRDLLAALHGNRSAFFAGRLSLLYAGERLVAGHFGAASPAVVTYGYMGLDDALSKHSPGMILLLHLIEHACQTPGTRFELGAGDQRYKQQLRTEIVQLGAGSVARSSLVKSYRDAKRARALALTEA